jgi:lysophospholipase L1-like esterase
VAARQRRVRGRDAEGRGADDRHQQHADQHPDEIAAGVGAICASIHERSPATKILLLAIFPRGQRADATRARVDEVNRRIAALDDRDYVTFLDIGAKFLEPDGSIAAAVMYDYLHPSAKGYEIWSAAMKPTLDRLLGGQ